MRYPPGPKPKFIVGNMPLAGRDPLGTYRRWASEYGDIFHYRFLRIHVYFLSHPHYIDYVLVRNARNFIKDRTTRGSRWLLGGGLLTSEGDFWMRQRRLAQPAFHRDRIAGYAAMMTGHTRDMLATWRDGARIDIHHEMMQLTMRIVIQCLFGQATDETRTISRSQDYIASRMTGIRLLIPGLLYRLSLPGIGGFRRSVDDLNDAVARIVELRRNARHEANDLLSMLLAAQDEDGTRMSDRQVRDEVMTFFLAGHETTALALSWTMYLLSRNPAATEKLHEELDRVLDGRLPELADLPALVWTGSIVKETLRLYPPAWCIGREPLEDFELGGFTIPKGSIVAMSQWVMHRDPRFFSDPETFDPSRWTAERERELPRFANFPFGGGPRQCIGNTFAMMEAVLLLATIAQRFEVRVPPDYTPEAVPGFTLRPRGGIPATIVERALLSEQGSAVKLK